MIRLFLGVILTFATIILGLFIYWYVNKDGDVLYSGQRSDHFDGRRFVNQEVVKGSRSLWEVFVWRVAGKRDAWPDEVVKAKKYDLPKPEAGEVVVTFINHASSLIQTGSLNILTDPQYNDRASPFTWIGPSRAHEPGIPYDKLPPIDVVIVSHDHYDHMDEKTLNMLKKDHDPLFLVGLGNDVHMRSFGITEKVQSVDWWQVVKVGNSEITFVPAQHFSGRWLFDRNATLWGGYVIQVDKAKLFFAGDTGYGPHFKEIFEKFGSIDLSMLPIGAFAPRWFMKTMHVNPEEAVLAHMDLHSKKSYGIHFKTFQLTDESFEQPVIDLAVAREKHGLAPEDFVAPEFGESFRVLK